MSSGAKFLITLFSFGMIVVSFLIGWWAKKKQLLLSHILEVLDSLVLYSWSFIYGCRS